MGRKRGMQFIPYDYEAAYNKAMEDMHEWFIENLFQHRKKVIYALKEITAGDLKDIKRESRENREEMKTLRERVVIVEQSLKSYHKRLDGEQHSDR